MFRAIRFGVLVAILASVSLVASAQTPPRNAEADPDFFKLSPVKAAVGDDRLRELLKQRYNAALEECQITYRVYLGGKVPLRDMVDVVRRLTQAGVALADTPSERITAWEQGLAAARAVEAIVQSKVDNEIEPRQALLRIQGLRYDLEIGLLRTRTAPR